MNEYKTEPAANDTLPPKEAVEPISPAVPPEVPLPSPERPTIALAVEHYIGTLRGIGQTAQIALPHIAQWQIDEMESTQRKLDQFIPELAKTGEGPVDLEFRSAHGFAEFTDTIRRIEELHHLNATAVLSKSLFTQLFAEYDAYIGELLRAVYLKNESLLKGVSREISLSDLLSYKDLESAKRAMLDKEIETFRRDSYVEQFASLEKKFGVPLKKFPEWSAFVELSQRRNVLTHNGGLVSDQYLTICDREGHVFDERPPVGTGLSVSFDYFAKALRLLSKIGLMLAYTLWSKVFPKESASMHQELNEAVFNCLRQKRWNLAAELTDFVLSESMKRGVSEVDLRIRVVNSAIGLKFSGKDAEARKLLSSIDWSASYRDFKLAIAVLEERFEDAVSLMKSIGKRGEIVDQHGYHTWPLFSKFRERPEFYAAYLEIYDQPFAERLDTPEGPLQAHAGPNTTSQIVEVEAREVITTTQTIPDETETPQSELSREAGADESAA